MIWIGTCWSYTTLHAHHFASIPRPIRVEKCPELWHYPPWLFSKHLYVNSVVFVKYIEITVKILFVWVVVLSGLWYQFCVESQESITPYLWKINHWIGIVMYRSITNTCTHSKIMSSLLLWSHEVDLLLSDTFPASSTTRPVHIRRKLAG